MVNYQYDKIDGELVEKNVAKAFRAWAADFKAATGCTLHVRSGTRTEAVQAAGRADYLAGRTAVVWAAPTESSHCEVGPAGPRALDLYDSGDDLGVTTKGTYRHDIAVDTGAKHGFTWGGWGVPASEGWHFENHKVKVGVYSTVANVVGNVVAAVTQPGPKAMLKWRWSGVQEMLKRYYRYTGRIDNIPGDGTVRAFQRFLNAKGYAGQAIGRLLAVDGKLGKNTVKAAQVWLRRYGYKGRIDGIPGSGTKAAFAAAERANAAAFNY